MRLPLFLLFALASTGFGQILPFTPRVWKNAQGKEVQAVMVKADAINVTLRLPNGNSTDFPYNLLSKDDQGYVDQIRKDLTEKLAKAAPQAAKPAAAPNPKAPGPDISLDTVTASQIYRLGVPVPGKSGTLRKVTGKVTNVSMIPGENFATIVVELEGGLCVSAKSYESIWGGSQWKLNVNNGELHKLAVSAPLPEDKPDPKKDDKDKDKKKDDKDKDKDKKKDDKDKDKKEDPKKAAPKPDPKKKEPLPADLAGRKLFGKGDLVTVRGNLHFAEETVGKVSGFYARGVSSIGLANPPPAPAAPATATPAATTPAKPAATTTPVKK